MKKAIPGIAAVCLIGLSMSFGLVQGLTDDCGGELGCVCIVDSIPKEDETQPGAGCVTFVQHEPEWDDSTWIDGCCKGEANCDVKSCEVPAINVDILITCDQNNAGQDLDVHVLVDPFAMANGQYRGGLVAELDYPNATGTTVHYEPSMPLACGTQIHHQIVVAPMRDAWVDNQGRHQYEIKGKQAILDLTDDCLKCDDGE